MNDRQRSQLVAYVVDADNISEEWQIDRWKSRVSSFLAEAIGEDEADRFRGIYAHSAFSELALKLGHIEGLIAKADDEGATKETSFSNREGAEPEPIALNTREVFVVHGHDGEAKESVARFLDKLGLHAIVLHEQSNQGRTLIEKFENSSRSVAFAVVLLTPDDIGGPSDTANADLRPRARQNVILELGYFMGRLSRTRVCALYKGGVELPSDFQGVAYLELDPAGAWKAKLAQELVQAKITINLEGIIS